MSVDWSDDEIVEQGSEPDRAPLLARLVRPIPAAVRRGALLLTAAVVITIALLAQGERRTGPDAQPAPGAEQVATDRAMALVEANARTTGPLHDYIRSNSTRGACALVPLGMSPVQRFASAITRSLPAYTLRDVSRTIDQFTAMCAMSVRAADAQGSVLVVSVAAPQQATTRAFTALTVGARADANDSVSIATALTRSGWSVTVGVVGPLSDEPSSADLQRLSQDPALLW